MTRTTIVMPAKLKAQAKRRAQEMKMSFGELVRQSLESEIKSRRKKSRSDDPLFSDNFVVRGHGPSDVAKNHDKYLLEALRKEHEH